jgi:hypothetical protein
MRAGFAAAAAAITGATRSNVVYMLLSRMLHDMREGGGAGADSIMLSMAWWGAGPIALMLWLDWVIR